MPERKNPLRKNREIVPVRRQGIGAMDKDAKVRQMPEKLSGKALLSKVKADWRNLEAQSERENEELINDILGRVCKSSM
jgi:hypothetical protein